jgi:hypothetical protein
MIFNVDLLLLVLLIIITIKTYSNLSSLAMMYRIKYDLQSMPFYCVDLLVLLIIKDKKWRSSVFSNLVSTNERVDVDNGNCLSDI